MGQTTGDCAIRDQHTTPAEQHPAGFHAELQTLDRAQLLPQSGAKPAECPSLPTLTINEQQTNQNAIRPADGKAIYSTYENLDLDVKRNGLPNKYPINEQQTNASAIRPADGNSIYSTYENLDLDIKRNGLPNQYPINERQTNANAIRPSEGNHPSKGNAIYSTYENLDLDVPPRSTVVPPPDENQNQSQLLNRIKAIAASSQ
jgi:hypothetical protein